VGTLLIEVTHSGSVRRVVRATSASDERCLLRLYQQISPEIDELSRSARRAASKPEAIDSDLEALEPDQVR